MERVVAPPHSSSEEWEELLEGSIHTADDVRDFFDRWQVGQGGALFVFSFLLKQSYC